MEAESLASKKLRYIEHLLTLGGLLAVFLGLALQSNAINPTLVFAGTTFSVAALLTYTYLLFGKEPSHSRISRIITSAMYSLLAASFSGIVLLAYSYAFTGAGAGNLFATLVIFAVLATVYFVIIMLITKVLDREDTTSQTPLSGSD